MKILVIIAALMLLPKLAGAFTAGNEVIADGFIKVYSNNYRVGPNQIYEYCDKSMPVGSGCYDHTFNSLNVEHMGEKTGKWRTADQYIKYKTSKSFEYIGMSHDTHRITLYYKKAKLYTDIKR